VLLTDWLVDCGFRVMFYDLWPQASLSSYSDSNWRIDWADLRMGKCIGRGGFGEVRAVAVMLVGGGGVLMTIVVLVVRSVWLV
jgi:hypothetical protein